MSRVVVVRAAGEPPFGGGDPPTLTLNDKARIVALAAAATETRLEVEGVGERERKVLRRLVDLYPPALALLYDLIAHQVPKD